MSMDIPAYVGGCMEALEQAGFAAYAVGGCVRDALLGRTPHDFDLCTDARPEQTRAVFSGRPLVLAGEKHGTVGVVTPEGVVEITTFRQEGGYGDNRRPDWVDFITDLREDLARRDFTVNAMAYSPARGLADPFGGRQDLEKKILRAVGDPDTRFREDSLRILRGVRFCAAYGLTPDAETEAAMLRQAHLMEHLARERVFEELNRLLPNITAPQLLRFAPVLAAVIPELGPMIGFDQHSPHHAYDLYTHVAHVVEAVPGEPVLRWAALLHDIGKVPTFTRDENGRGHFYGHAQAGEDMAEQVLRRLKAPTALREQVKQLIGLHMTRLEPEKKRLRRMLNRLGTDTVLRLLDLQQADMGSKGTGTAEEMGQFAPVRELLAEILAEDSCLSLKDLAVNGSDLMALGYSGREIGRELDRLLELVLEETLPNTREALLAAAKEKQ